MKKDFKIREKVVRNILFLMIIFLPASSLANYINDRLEFTILYFTSTFLTILIFFKYKKNANIDKTTKHTLILLFCIFFSFIFLGSQNTFDIFWVLVLPMTIIMLESYNKSKVWLIIFNLLLISSLLISYMNLTIIKYESFALWSLLWAGIFMSYMALHYKKTQLFLEKEIDSYQNNLEEKVKKATKQINTLNIDLEETQKEILRRLGNLGEFRSNETGSHVIRVGLYSKKLALLYGFDKKKAEQINLTAPLHDIGKVGIEDSILNKPAKLTKEEFEIMKKHATIGQSILEGSNKPLIQMACEIAGGHHEKYDGSGYPKGLKAEEIPLSARIVAIADVFDALYSKRSYKNPWKIEDIKDYFIKNSALHFDPKLVKLFLENIDDFIKIYHKNI